MTKSDDIRAKRRAEIAASAAEHFKNHVIKDEGHGRWSCAKPGDSAYSFRITDFRDGLILSGDIDELVLIVYRLDPIAWLRGCVNSEDYVLSKIAVPFRKKEVIEELVLEFFKDSADDPDESKIVKNLRDAWDISDEEAGTPNEHIPDLTEDEWIEAYYEAGGEDDPPNVSDWPPRILFQLEALKWFCRALAESESMSGGARE